MSTLRLLCLLFQLMNSKVGTMQSKTKPTKRDLMHGKFEMKYEIFTFRCGAFHIMCHKTFRVFHTHGERSTYKVILPHHIKIWIFGASMI